MNILELKVLGSSEPEGYVCECVGEGVLFPAWLNMIGVLVFGGGGVVGPVEEGGNSDVNDTSTGYGVSVK